MSSDKFLEQLQIDEGFSKYPYQDSRGVWTIGFGRNLDDVGISKTEALVLLANDVQIAKDEVAKVLRTLNIPEPHLYRKEVLYNMMFNLGWNRFLNFVKMLKALRQQNYEDAAKEMLDSLWAKQVGARAIRLAEQMRTTKIED